MPSRPQPEENMIGPWRLIIALALLAVPVVEADAVNYMRLSPSESAEDLQKASEMLTAGEFAAAIAVLDPLIDDEPDNADALSLMGYALRKSGELDRAEVYYQRALSEDPRHPGALQYLGELYVQQGRLDLAENQVLLLRQACGSDCDGLATLEDALAAARSGVRP